MLNEGNQELQKLQANLTQVGKKNLKNQLSLSYPYPLPLLYRSYFYVTTTIFSFFFPHFFPSFISLLSHLLYHFTTPQYLHYISSSNFPLPPYLQLPFFILPRISAHPPVTTYPPLLLHLLHPPFSHSLISPNPSPSYFHGSLHIFYPLPYPVHDTICFSSLSSGHYAAVTSKPHLLYHLPSSTPPFHPPSFHFTLLIIHSPTPQSRLSPLPSYLRLPMHLFNPSPSLAYTNVSFFSIPCNQSSITTLATPSYPSHGYSISFLPLLLKFPSTTSTLPTILHPSIDTLSHFLYRFTFFILYFSPQQFHFTLYPCSPLLGMRHLYSFILFLPHTPSAITLHPTLYIPNSITIHLFYPIPFHDTPLTTSNPTLFSSSSS